AVIAFVSDDRDAHRRTLVHRLHDIGPCDRIFLVKALARHDLARRHADAVRDEDHLGQFLVDGDNRRFEAAVRVRNAHQVHHALDRSVLAGCAVECIEDHVGLQLRKASADVATHVELGDVRPAALTQCRCYALAAGQRHFALGGPAPHQDDDVDVLVHGSPTRWISHSRLMWVFASTRRRTSSPSASISALVALPRLSRKLQCFSETWASPIVSPRQPAASTSTHALWPGGFLKVDPPVRLRSGCDSSRARAMASISAPIASGSPGVPRNTASITTAPAGTSLCR